MLHPGACLPSSSNIFALTSAVPTFLQVLLVTTLFLQCDGSKPSCHTCQQKGISTCHYDPPSTKIRDAGLLSEAIGLLDSMTPSRANAALAAVQDLNRDVDIITTLRDRAGASERDSDDTTGTLSDLRQLLGRMHPFSYPNLEPVDPNEPSNYLLKRIVTPWTKKQGQKQQRGCEDMPYATCALPVRALSAP
jgi:hypothetical protein